MKAQHVNLVGSSRLECAGGIAPHCLALTFANHADSQLYGLMHTETVSMHSVAESDAESHFAFIVGLIPTLAILAATLCLLMVSIHDG